MPIMVVGAVCNRICVIALLVVLSDDGAFSMQVAVAAFLHVGCPVLAQENCLAAHAASQWVPPQKITAWMMGLRVLV